MRIHIITSSKTMGYHDFCVNNHLSLADKPTEIEFLSHCMDEGCLSSAKRTSGNSKLTGGGTGSVGHALGIQSVLSNLAPGMINIVSDSDCIVLKKGWDTTIRNLMSEYKIIGSTYEDIGGFSSGSGLGQTFKRIPNFTWVALSPDFSWDFDAMCQKQDLLLIDTQELSETFNLPIGYSLFREPIWKLPVYIRENKVKHYPLVFVRPTSGNARAVTTGEDYHTEYQLNDGTPFVAHQRGSLSKEFRQHHLSKTFYDACEKYIGDLP